MRKYKLTARQYSTLIVGSGAAGFSAAERLYLLGQKNIALITEHVNAGTSRNTGSDKQTYYKLTIAGSQPDSVQEMANTLMNGACVDGDLALCEAALSTRCFFHLVELGVPFPCNRYGEYIGYKTDHDPRERATSAGPYTSKMMTEALQKSVAEKGIPILDHMQVIRLLSDKTGIRGVLCLDLSQINSSKTPKYTVYLCQNLILATGGPAGIYEKSVYPLSQHGSSGLAFEIGALGKNLTEWQYGISSIRPRWNVSGTYMQSLPRFISTDARGNDVREFLLDYFDNPYHMLHLVFLKGYQWPFDIQKCKDGSSLIDILVYLEEQKGRRVYLDFSKNPYGEIDFEKLPAESRNYLARGHACFGTPYDRLSQLNKPAIDFYLSHGIDLKTEYLEISLCAQHNNGGLAIDAWWQTNIRGLFCIGEASASHGIYRPGGTALNAGQVGALRAAQYIAATTEERDLTDCIIDWSDSDLSEVKKQIDELISMGGQILGNGSENISALIKETQHLMSTVGAAFRNTSDMENLLKKITETLTILPNCCHGTSLRDLKNFYLLREILLSQRIYLTAMIDYCQNNPYSRGSALYQNTNGEKPLSLLPDQFRYCTAPEKFRQKIQEIGYTNDQIHISWRDPRPIPTTDTFFENVWKEYRKNKNIY